MNSMAFDPKEKENMKKLIKFLIEDYDSEEYYNEVHVTTDGYCTIVEWDTVPYDRTFGGKFEYVDENHEVLKVVHFPDNHYEYMLDEDEKTALDEWLKENPEYTKTSYEKCHEEKDEDLFDPYDNKRYLINLNDGEMKEI